ncbi:hypothetical protein J2S13_000161 [Oikeobacillus pervagus]|uniref:Z-ring formation inhibitor MciZ n=1 Tax=Oikeobacillus pervagus TaxID=1325931 RepID=A0AAJ1WFC1_9BACI|nr:Z-ring formation inhibitor MciZ [Oikeobacillus pervagus]MDQ0213767.1 hypothetical protein [Oikeobacillus pervagus]
MKVYLKHDRVILTGNYQEIQYLLTKYRKQFTYVKDWIEANSPNC